MASDPRRKRPRPGHRPHRSPSSRRHGRKSLANSKGDSSKQRKSRDAKPTSSFSSPQPSSAPVVVEPKKEPPPIWRAHLLGLAGVTLLVLLGGGHNLFALSFSLLLPGISLLFRPPKISPGIWLDRLGLAFLGALLLAFLPQFYWATPEWRHVAEETFQISLPASLSVRPWASFEAWMLALAGFAWFYAVSAWEINHQGRRWFFFALSLVVGILAAVVLWGNAMAASYPLGGEATGFSFFSEAGQTANFLAVGGVAAFGYAMSGLRHRRLLPLSGIIASGLCFFALLFLDVRAGVILFFAGLWLGYFLQLSAGHMPKGIKVGFALILVVLSVLLANEWWSNRQTADPAELADRASEGHQAPVVLDSWGMIQGAPLTGHGIGTFASVFPQYRDHSADDQRRLHPGSDLLWLTAESGILGTALLLGFILVYLLGGPGRGKGSAGGFRLAAFTAVLLFLVHGLIGVAGHRPGTVYFAILLAVLILPQAKGRKTTAYRTWCWRLCGGALVLVGLLWGLSGLTGLPVHSSVAVGRQQSKVEASIAASKNEAALRYAGKWIDLRPLDWRAYFQRATLTLAHSGARESAAADFRRARFAEPNLGVVALEEGFAWIPYDTGRTLAAWREVFFRELESPEGAFQRMLDAASKNPELMAGLGQLSEFDAYYRTYFLNYQSGDYLMQELARDLENNSGLSHFSRKQRTSIVKNWIERGDKLSAESFLEAHESSLERPWWLWSLLRKESAKFEDAVNRIRLAITPPVLSETTTGEIPYERLKREFSLTPGDIIKGTALLNFYLKQDNFRKISELTRTMVDSQKDAPLYVRYWHAESFFRLGDYIESWYAYEEYLKQLWAE